MDSRGLDHCDLPLTFRRAQRHSNWSYTNERIIINGDLWLGSPVLKLLRQHIMIRRNGDRMYGLEQGGELTNEQQGVGPPWLAFDFSTSAETWQLILHQWKDPSKWQPLAQFSSAVIIKAQYYDPTKWRLYMWCNTTFVYCSYVIPTQNEDNNSRKGNE